MFKLLFRTIILFVVLIWSGVGSAQQTGIWVYVDTDRQILTVFDGEVPKEVFKNIAIGQGGTTLTKQTGDKKTPLGRYKISWVNLKSKYRTFYGFNYPNLEDAERALADGRTTPGIARQIKIAHQQHKSPSQHTGLGGMLGIHGLGRADPGLHQRMNWTRGCIALTNQQIDRLGRWIKLGTLVLVQ